MKVPPLTVAEEHRFWLEILGDHAHFVHDHLSPSEVQWVQAAAGYIRAFCALLHRLDTLPPKPPSSPEWVAFAKEAYSYAAGYYKLEGQLQALRIANQVNLNLSPTYLNGTLSENQEYLRLLGYYVQGVEAPGLPLWNLMELWMEDQLGHAVLLRNILDPVEIPLTNEAATIATAFQAHLTKSRAIHGYLRFTPPDFPAQLEFAREVSATVVRFYLMVLNVVTKYRRTEVLSRTTLRFLEHHIPETCYFLRKLTELVPDIEDIPNCPLTKPSFPEC